MRTLGPYTILEQLGRGGQGVVFLAEDTRLKRKVALKVIETVGDMAADRLERFRREAESASRLDHPYICAIHEASEIDGVPYIAMRYVEGETLAERIERARDRHDSGTESTPSSRDEIHAVLLHIEKVARALHVAHELGLIHRDIKPGNIMLTDDDDPVVLDFGLARDEFSGDAMSLTHSGDLLGTPAYMSPEQLMAQRIPLDRRTDIYSLGATLYESLTLRRPFEATTRAELYQRIMTHEPSSAMSINRAIPADLQVVLETALEKDRDRRYHTALDFAEDLRRVRRFEPIRAKPIGRLLRLKRWTQRHPVGATAVAGLVVALVVAIVLLGHVTRSLADVRVLALAKASAKAAQSDQMLGLLLAREAARAEMRPETFAQLHTMLFKCRELRVLRLPDRAFGLKISADGTRILTASRYRGAALWDASNGEEIARFPHGGLDARFDRTDPELVITAGVDGMVRVWRVGRSDPLEEYGAQDKPIEGIGISSDGTRIVSASWDGTAIVWKRGMVAPLAKLDCGSNAHFAEFWPGDEDYVLTTHLDGAARLWHLDRPGEPVRLYRHGAIQVNGAAIAPDRRHFVTTGLDRRAVLWHRDHADRPVAILRGHDAAVEEVAISRDWIVTGGRDHVLRVFDRSTFELVSILRGHSGRIDEVEFASDDTIVSTGADQAVRFWALELPDARELRGHRHEVLAVDVTSDGRRMVTGARGGECFLWDMASGEVQRTFRNHGKQSTRSIYAVEFSKTDSKLVSVDNAACVFEVETGELLGRRYVSGDGARWAIVDEDASVLMTSLGRIGVTRWDWRKKSESRLFGETNQPHSYDQRVWRSPHDGKAVIWTRERHAYVGDVTTGERGAPFEHESTVRSAAFSPVDPNLVVTGTNRGVAVLWEVAARRRVLELSRHAGAVTTVEFHPNGDRFLTASRDATVQLWDLDGRLLASFVGHKGPINMARFSPDGTRIVTASSDRTVRVWIVDADELVQAAETRLAGRRFSAAALEPYRHLLGERVEELSAK